MDLVVQFGLLGGAALVFRLLAETELKKRGKPVVWNAQVLLGSS
jgi:hypothetical protein